MQSNILGMESVTQNSSDTAHAPEEKRQHTERMLVGVLVLVVVTLAAGIFATIRYYPPANQLWSAWTLPSELRGALFITRGAEVSTYTATEKGYVPETIAQGSNIVYAAPKDDNLLVLVDPVTGAYRLELDGPVLLTSKQPMTTASLSPNGLMVAYAKQMEGKSGSRDAADWEVIVFYPLTGKSVWVSPGFAPFFRSEYFVTKLITLFLIFVGVSVSIFRETAPFPLVFQGMFGLNLISLG